ncbi:MAG: hypothetical protein A2504_01890 [Bdellovibrionales bacterium RIFOXYD12_FULL_39_22]|nr:MAG: hypothetical protein A2385_04415 [Bdellovibrionales bacterium RIFOXYB1_FULL_39_21]OFZ42342.1 MAG: hypothetical protein A2485_15080 [Bdellovibrionales bacterium RIFOXYC12_FULL_39_17]OFZ46357.1 MAG: hypothetical protein A2404_13935 [Bdellovibrionales bacterium RIFOXYC1_FULL_39_130]OFZ75250.1 MAG: hypothetical protein A2560_15990 [Bdellovibrionales bacterium RIFOXYD1_FULL_39_84]OFZ93244.1 MAG: hypothetical protein A2504_01890 [Bdellovibrionales bacterium RIFOXYD12_FULL_39_22]HLE11046.1 hy
MRHTHVRIIFLISLLVSLGTFSAHAVLRIANSCSSELIATAKSVTDLETPLSSSASLQKIRVTFNLKSIIRGAAQDEFFMDFLKHGPVEIISGENYQLILNNGWICAIKKL